MNEEELEREDTWDLEAAKVHKPRSSRRTVVSVGMSSDEFRLIARSAERASMKVSEFIRDAAVEKARIGHVYLLQPSSTLSLSHSVVVEPFEDETQVLSMPSQALLMEVGGA